MDRIAVFAKTPDATCPPPAALWCLNAMPQTRPMEIVMKQFECGSLVPGCTWHTQAEDTAEVVRRAAEHLRTAHDEGQVRPSLVEQIKARVHDADHPLEAQH
jgi:predicted small metal-binding protein